MNMPSKDTRVVVYLIAGAAAAVVFASVTLNPNQSIFSGCLENPGIIASVLDVVAVALMWIAAVLGYGLLGAAASGWLFGAVVDPTVAFVCVLVFAQRKHQGTSIRLCIQSSTAVMFFLADLFGVTVCAWVCTRA